METKEEIAKIRKLLKMLTPTVSVRNGRGTAWGWVEISGSGEYGNFTDSEKEGLMKAGLSYGGNFAVIHPDDREYRIEKLKIVTGQPDHLPPDAFRKLEAKAEEDAKWRSYD
jgi:hypothetical protein